MLSVQITDIGKLTGMLFSGNEFDRFLLHDMTLKTSFLTSFSGEILPEFYEGETSEIPENAYVSWEKLRPLSESLLKGKHLPLSFKIVLLTSKKTTEALKAKAGFTDCDVSSLSLTLIFREKALYLMTGISLLGFSMDKSLEKLWDQTVEQFLTSKDVRFV